MVTNYDNGLMVTEAIKHYIIFTSKFYSLMTSRLTVIQWNIQIGPPN